MSEAKWAKQIGEAYVVLREQYPAALPSAESLATAVEEYTEARLATPKDEEGFVYFIGEEPRSDEWVKVGWAKDPQKRLATLQTGNPRRLKLLAAAPGPRAAESWAHEQLREFRSWRGSEWFQGLNDDGVSTLGLIEGVTVGDLVAEARDASN